LLGRRRAKGPVCCAGGAGVTVLCGAFKAKGLVNRFSALRNGSKQEMRVSSNG